MAKKRRPVSQPAEEPVKQKSIDINYKIAGDIGLLYADQYTFQFYADEFVISFFQTEHPLVFSGEDFDKRNDLEARCIARFVLNPNQMRRFAIGLNQNVQKWREIHMSEGAGDKGEVKK